VNILCGELKTLPVFSEFSFIGKAEVPFTFSPFDIRIRTRRGKSKTNTWALEDAEEKVQARF
jgi:hypothetical protein